MKLVDRKIEGKSDLSFFLEEDKSIKIEKKGDDIILFSSSGYPCEESAVQNLVSMLLRAKIMLLKRKIPHLDWLSLNTSQRFATEVIGSLFEKRGMVPTSFKPQVYETKRLPHWPGATLAQEGFELESINEIAFPEIDLNPIGERTLEALNVLGLALADPHAKSKLILAMTAVEILSDRAAVDEVTAKALDSLKSKVSEIDAAQNLKDRFSKLLDDAKRESISKAGKRLVKEVLGGAKAKEFYKLYDIRSEIVHGNTSRLSLDFNGHKEIEQHAEAGFNLALDLALKFREPQLQ